MYGMTYEQRTRAIFEFLYRKDGGLLRRYRAPEHLSDDAMRDEVNMLVQDVNQVLPSEVSEGEMQSLLPEINSGVRRRHGAQGWPPAKVMIAATEDAIVACAKKKADAEPVKNISLDPYEITARRMRAGEPVSEAYLWGRDAVQLIAKGLVDKETMVKYRDGAFDARKERAGEASARAWEDDASDRHDAAREAYHQRKNEDGIINSEVLRRLQEDLDGLFVSIERRRAAIKGAA